MSLFTSEKQRRVWTVTDRLEGWVRCESNDGRTRDWQESWLADKEADGTIVDTDEKAGTFSFARPESPIA